MIDRVLLTDWIGRLVGGLIGLKDEGHFDEPNLDGTKGDYVSFDNWEWPQGVGLYGLAQLWLQTGDDKAKAILEAWYANQLAAGLPSQNVNTTAPMLALSLLWRKTREEKWEAPRRDWADRSALSSATPIAPPLSVSLTSA